jgi:hypothetical protein
MEPGQRRLIASCVTAIALACAAGAAHALEPLTVAPDSSAIAVPRTAVLCEALVFIDYKQQKDRLLIGQSRGIAERVVAAAVQALRRSGRAVGPALHASSGILLDPEETYSLAWERPLRERAGSQPLGRPPFNTDARFAAGGRTLADWRELAKRVTAHDSTTAPEAARLARGMGAGELLVIVVRGSRTTAREQLKWNPLAGMVDDERVNNVDAWTGLDLALYSGDDGRRMWAFTSRLSGWNGYSGGRLAEWTEAAVKLLPAPGAQGGQGDAGTPGFRPPYHDQLTLRLGRVQVGDGHAALGFGTRAARLFRPWISAGIQIDWQAVRSSRLVMGGSETLAGVPLEYQRELHHVELDLSPVYPVIEVHLPRFANTFASAGVSGGYALAFLKAPGYETQIFGGWGWAAHTGLGWRAPRRAIGIGLEAMYQRAQPEHNGTDPLTLAPVRERLDLDGWGLSLSLNVWQ